MEKGAAKLVRVNLIKRKKTKRKKRGFKKNYNKKIVRY